MNCVGRATLWLVATSTLGPLAMLPMREEEIPCPTGQDPPSIALGVAATRRGPGGKIIIRIEVACGRGCKASQNRLVARHSCKQ